MRISRLPEFDPEATLGGQPAYVDVLEGDQEFLDAISLRLEQIVAKPKGRFVISYTSGRPGAKRPPTIH
jgi:hypothetical protein